MKILPLALKNLTRQKRRSFILAGAIAFAFFITLAFDGLATGAITAIEEQFCNFFGGQIFIMGTQKPEGKKETDRALSVITDTSAIDKVIAESNVQHLYITKRSQLYGTIIFEGQEFSSTIMGCRFDDEKDLKKSISIKDGSWEKMKTEDALLISETIANELKLQIGDSVLFKTQTASGQSTVADLVIGMIVKDKSMFGVMNVYANLHFLNKIEEVPENSIAAYNIFLKNPNDQQLLADKLEIALAKHGPTASRAIAKEQNPQRPSVDIMRQLNDGLWQGTKYGVATMYDFAPEIVTLAGTIQAISLVVLTVLLIITMIGVANTFRMILYERRGEIGTMRSCGIYGSDVKKLFVSEAVLLALFGALVGGILALAAMQLVTLIHVPVDSPFSGFTNTNGLLLWKLSPIAVAIKFIVVGLLTAFAVYGSASKAAKLIPAHALRTAK